MESEEVEGCSNFLDMLGSGFSLTCLDVFFPVIVLSATRHVANANQLPTLGPLQVSLSTDICIPAFS